MVRLRHNSIVKLNGPSPKDCAAELLEVVPLIMRSLRAEARSRRTADLSVPQFRALAFVGRNQGAKLSDLANFLGLTAPSASKLIDGLVVAKFVSREVPSGDRRRVSLALSAAGSREYRSVLRQARSYLARKVEHLGRESRGRLLAALNDLRAAFEGGQMPEIANGRGSLKQHRRKRRGRQSRRR